MEEQPVFSLSDGMTVPPQLPPLSVPLPRSIVCVTANKPCGGHSQSPRPQLKQKAQSTQSRVRKMWFPWLQEDRLRTRQLSRSLTQGWLMTSLGNWSSLMSSQVNSTGGRRSKEENIPVSSHCQQFLWVPIHQSQSSCLTGLP